MNISPVLIYAYCLLWIYVYEELNKRLMEIKITFESKGEKNIHVKALFFHFPKISHNHLKNKKKHRMFCNTGLPPKDETVKTTWNFLILTIPRLN